MTFFRHSDPERSEGEESHSIEILRRPAFGGTPQNDEDQHFATVPRWPVLSDQGLC